MYSCANEEEVQKYETMRLENNELLSNIDLIIENQQSKFDSINKLIDNYILGKIKSRDPSWDIDANKAIDVRHNMELLKISLKAQDLNYQILERANKKLVYVFKNRNSIKRLYINRIDETNNKIKEITGTLSVKTYINNYLP
jgi:hypothetical protein